MLTLKETRNIHDSMNRAKIKYILLLISTFYYKYLIYRNYLYSGNKTVLYLICNHINGFVGV